MSHNAVLFSILVKIIAISYCSTLNNYKNGLQAFEPEITKELCLQMGICEDVPNYPQDMVDELVEELKASGYKFNIDRLVTPEIGQRIGPDGEMVNLCGSREIVIPPKAIYDPASDKNYTVLNGNNHTVQSYRFELCKLKSAPCSDLIYVDSNAYSTTCVQKYQYRRMMVLNENITSDTEVKKYIEKEFQVPSCCACALYPVAQFGNR